jgi:hypothetical protein
LTFVGDGATGAFPTDYISTVYDAQDLAVMLDGKADMWQEGRIMIG